MAGQPVRPLVPFLMWMIKNVTLLLVWLSYCAVFSRRRLLLLEFGVFCHHHLGMMRWTRGSFPCWQAATARCRMTVAQHGTLTRTSVFPHWLGMYLKGILAAILGVLFAYCNSVSVPDQPTAFSAAVFVFCSM